MRRDLPCGSEVSDARRKPTFAMPADRERTLAARMDGHLIKPIVREEPARIVAELAARSVRT